MKPETVGPYRVLEPLREGGVSSVYRAQAPGGAVVALKVFSLSLLAVDAPGAGAPPITPGSPGSAAPTGPPSSPTPSAARTPGTWGPAGPAGIAARFHREVQAVVPLKHPNILQVLGTGEDGEFLHLATQLFDG